MGHLAPRVLKPKRQGGFGHYFSHADQRNQYPNKLPGGNLIREFS